MLVLYWPLGCFCVAFFFLILLPTSMIHFITQDFSLIPKILTKGGSVISRVSICFQPVWLCRPCFSFSMQRDPALLYFCVMQCRALDLESKHLGSRLNSAVSSLHDLSKDIKLTSSLPANEVRTYLTSFLWRLGNSMGTPCGSAGKESAHNAGDPGLVPGLRRSPGEGKGCTLQYSGLENSMDYSPWGHKESDTTERLSLSENTICENTLQMTKYS